MTASNPAHVGILGIGLFLPETVRTNDHWPAELVASWADAPVEDNPVASARHGAVWRAVQALRDDPFGGARTRRIVDPEMSASMMEAEVGRRALASAGVDASAIDLVLVSSWMPTLIGTNDACTAHELIGLPTECLTLTTESSFNGFQHQVSLAQAMIRAGQARHALLIQSTTISRCLPYDKPYSPWFGDGASAVVLGPTGPEAALLSAAHRTIGIVQGALLTGVPDRAPKDWYQSGPQLLHVAQPELSIEILDRMAECARESTAKALADAGFEARDVDFYASHQPTPWFRPVTQTAAGLDHAATGDTFELLGSLGASNIPAALYYGAEQGRLKPGDLVASHAGGAGGTWGSMVFRWGVPADAIHKRF